MLKMLIKGYLESLKKHDEPAPCVIPAKAGIQKEHLCIYI